MKTHRWCVVGGGILGMTLALRLAQQGKSVTLMESAPSLGGLASAWNLGDVTWDRHYHVTLGSDSYTRSLLRELGLEHEMQWKQTRTGFYVDSNLYSMSNTLEFLQFPPLRFIDKLRLGANIFYASKVKNWKKLEKISAIEWLQRWSGRKTVEAIWAPLLRAKLGENYKEASAAFIWATIARMYAARQSGMKKEMFGYVPGGYARILDRFAEALLHAGVHIQLSQSVRQIEAIPGGQLRVERSGGEEEFFDQVVITTPGPIIARLCPDLTQHEKDLLRGIKYQGVICASLLLKKPLANFYVTNIVEPWVPFTAVIEMSALVDRKHFAGNALVYLPKYVPSDSPDFDLTDDALQTRFLQALERMYPDFDRRDLLCFRVSRVRHVLAIPTINYSERLPPAATSVPGLHAINSSHILNGTLNVNETLQLAEKASECLLSLSSSRTHTKNGVNYEAVQALSQPLAGSRQ